ncbi:Mismatch repair protein msh3 [Tieghemiomyces parasiticus]|uniref:DNA mismatch repair protein MSH3 n=1 Tax=Tieghemiomyces parasiticus TaxID=78921 RepID=A0A9W8A5V1_9FUNG|nr:Mismatch repair protein msh3 [Tieghemiomyces parasiticus]
MGSDPSPTVSRHFRTKSPSSTDRTAAKRSRHEVSLETAPGPAPATPPEPSAAKRNPAFTPLEEQYETLKAQNPTTLLALEVGYKYRFFGPDAEAAAEVLSIQCSPGHNLSTASVPGHRIHVHIRRLVDAGYRVGLVRQTETAALKAVSGRRRAPFGRALSEVYTRGTLIESLLVSTDTAPEPEPPYLVCLVDSTPTRTGRTEIGFLAVCVSTGSVVYDNFADNAARTALQTRLGHLSIGEIVLPRTTSVPTQRTVDGLLRSCGSRAGRSMIRCERLTTDFTDYTAALAFITAHGVGRTATASPTFLFRLPPATLRAMAYLVAYLIDFGLQGSLYRFDRFVAYQSEFYMALDAETLRQLEVVANQSDGTTAGTLLVRIDHTRTPMGRRCLRHWLQRPLVHRARLEERRIAVHQLSECTGSFLDDLRAILVNCPDLDRGLARIFSAQIPAIVLPSNITSPQIQEALASVRRARDSLQEPLSTVDLSAAARDDLDHMLRESPQIAQWRQNIRSLEADLRVHLDAVRLSLKYPEVHYAHVNGTRYQLEIPKETGLPVPLTWVKVSGTRQVDRYHSPYIAERLAELNWLEESITGEARVDYVGYLRTLGGDYYEVLQGFVRQLANLDALAALAVAGRQPGYVRAELSATDAEDATMSPTLEFSGLHHPILYQALGSGSYVANSLALGKPNPRAVVLTGPNMGGKSCLIKAVALLCILVQAGSHVPCTAARMAGPLLDAIFTRIGARDDPGAGESTFALEMRETSTLLHGATPRSLVLLDELGRGTGTWDGRAIARAVLDHLVDEVGCLCLFVTHDADLARAARRRYPAAVGNVYMDYRLVDGSEGSGEPAGTGPTEVVFLYRAVPGVCERSYGLGVARMALLPLELIERARTIAQNHRAAVGGPGPPVVAEFRCLLRSCETVDDTNI